MIWPFRRSYNTPVISTLQSVQDPASSAKSFPQPGTVFTPTHPRQGVRSLIGRSKELGRILQALSDDHAHVVLYSERGRGKTSLANAVVERLRQSATVVCRYSCEADSTYDDIIVGLALNLPSSLMKSHADVMQNGCAACLPTSNIRPDDVAALPARLDCRGLVCVVDEFDRVTDPSTAARMADTIKKLSDRRVPLQFIIVGVSENLEQMLVQHQSIQRNIAAVQLPPLRDVDIATLIEGAIVASGGTISGDVTKEVVLLTRGSPHLAQLLGLRLMQSAAARGSIKLEIDDFNSAVVLLLQEASPQDASLWSAMTANGRNMEVATAMQRLAVAKHDEWGRIYAPPDDSGGVHLGEICISASAWDVIGKAKLLSAAPVGSDLYVFRNRSMMHYILMLSSNHKEAGGDTDMRLFAGRRSV